jgi:hypothetical protein
MRPIADVLAVISLVITLVLAGGGILQGHLLVVLVVVAAAVLIGAWPVIYYLGDLSRIMGNAASSENAARRVRSDMQEGMRNAGAYAQLRRLYAPIVKEASASLVEAGWAPGFELATGDTEVNEYASVELHVGGATGLDNFLGVIREAPNTKRGEDLGENRQRLMHAWANLDGWKPKLGFEKGDNYSLVEIRVERGDQPRLCLEVAVVEYGAISRTCEALVNEFALFAFLTTPGRGHGDATTQSEAMEPSTVLGCMPLRHHVHRLAENQADIFLRPIQRAAGLGLAVVTAVVEDDGVRYAFFAERSSQVGTYPKTMHVIPAGNCNAHGTYRDGPNQLAAVPSWYLRTKMRCEFLEEWYKREDLEASNMPDWRPFVNKAWAEMIVESESILLTGLAFDLLNLRPEVCATVVIDLDKCRPMPGINDEWTWGEPPRKWPLADVGRAVPTDFVQSAAAALLLAKAAHRDARNATALN